MARTVRVTQLVLYAMMAICSAALLMVEGTEGNATSVLGEDVISGHKENATTAAWIGHPAVLAVEGNPPHRGPRQTEQRDQRCALSSFIGGGSSSDGTADTVLESTRTVDRYLVKPAAYYENRVTYREKPAVANLLIRRRRPVPVQRIGMLPYYVQRMDFADLGRRPPDDEPTAVSMTADDVRRLLQRVYSEGVIAGGEMAATASPNFDSKVLPLKGSTYLLHVIIT